MFIPPCSRLLILACSATKRGDAGRIPAIQRYDGSLWRTLRHYDPESRKARVAFLSARYGFRNAHSPIEDYDAHLTDEIAARMIAEAQSLRSPPPGNPSRVTPGGEHPGMHIARMIGRGGRPIEDVALVGGRLYLRVMRSLIEAFQASGKISPKARVTEINGPIGMMRRDLRCWLDGKPGEAR